MFPLYYISSVIYIQILRNRDRVFDWLIDFVFLCVTVNFINAFEAFRHISNSLLCVQNYDTEMTPERYSCDTIRIMVFSGCNYRDVICVDVSIWIHSHTIMNSYIVSLFTPFSICTMYIIHIDYGLRKHFC